MTKRWTNHIAIVLLALIMTGCASYEGVMKPVANVKADTAIPAAKDKAMIVFMRPSTMGGAIQSSVFDISGKTDQFIGLVSPLTKVAYVTEPGDKLFMVVGENADFMHATVEAGKTYYALVSPRMGVMYARFSLLPVRNDSTSKYRTQSDEFKEWMSTTEYVERLPESNQWYEKNKVEINEKKVEYLKKWDVMHPKDKAVLTLQAKDGL